MCGEMSKLLLLAIVMSMTISLSVSDPAAQDLASSLHHVRFLDLKALHNLKKSQSVSVIYYYVKDKPGHNSFFYEYDKSAKLLEAYDITLAIFDCNENVEKHPKCNEKDVEQYVYTYQNDADLLPLEIETMFDVNSIMSNALQLLLIQEVPIVQSRLERQSLEKSFAGQHDLIFAFPQAVGTQEHRIFMEIAYTFQDKYKFALTTEFKSTIGLQDSKLIHPSANFALWTLFCSELKESETLKEAECRSVLYKGEPTLLSIANYVKKLSEQTMFYAPRDGTTALFQSDDSLFPVIFLYHTDLEDKRFVELVDFLAVECNGYATVIVVDMKDKECVSEAEKQGFTGILPALSVKTNQESMTFMEQDPNWDFSRIAEFLDPFVFVESQHEMNEADEDGWEEGNDSSSSDSNIIQEVETQDDQVAKAVFSSHGKQLRSVQVPSLLKSSFDDSVNDSDLKIILFYLPFDATSMAFLLDFDAAWTTLREEGIGKEVLASVNCFDATDLCAIQNITTYPVVKIFQNGKRPQLYEGPLDTLSIVKAVKLLMLKGPIVLETENDVDTFVNGNSPQDLSSYVSTSVLFLARQEDKDTHELFDEAFNKLSTFDIVGVVKENMLNSVSKKFNTEIPAFVCFNRKDDFKPIKVLNKWIDSSSIVKFVKLAAIPTMPELGVSNFPALYAMGRPFVIVFMNPTESQSMRAKDLVTEMAPEFDQKAIFCWMDAQVKTLGIRLLSEYTWTATLPVITVVNHTQGKVYNFQQDSLSKDDLNSWLSSVLDGKMKPSKYLPAKKWKAPGQHYDFLAMIDKEHKAAMGKSVSDNVQQENDEAVSDGQESASTQPEEDEYLKIENEIREELLELRKSRLYQYTELKQKKTLLEDLDDNNEKPAKEKIRTHIHDHVEL